MYKLYISFLYQSFVDIATYDTTSMDKEVAQHVE